MKINAKVKNRENPAQTKTNSYKLFLTGCRTQIFEIKKLA